VAGSWYALGKAGALAPQDNWGDTYKWGRN